MIATSPRHGPLRITGTTYNGTTTTDVTEPTNLWRDIIGYTIDERGDAFISLSRTVTNFILEWKDIFAMFWDWVQSFKGRRRTKRNRRSPNQCCIGAKPDSEYG
jgi:hypothetical protein